MITRIILLFFLASTAHHAISAATSDVARIDIALDKTKYIVGEPFTVRVRLVNLKGTEFSMEDSFAFGRQLYLSHRHESDAEARIWQPAVLVDVVYGRPRKVGPAGIETSRMFAGLPFIKPGRYEVQVEYWSQNRSMRLQSNIVSVSVSALLPGEEEPLSLWTDPETLFALDNPGTAGAETGLGNLTAIGTRFGSTRYGELARAAMKRHADAAAAVAEPPPPVSQPIPQTKEETPRKSPESPGRPVPSNEIPSAHADTSIWLFVGSGLVVAILLIWVFTKRR